LVAKEKSVHSIYDKAFMRAYVHNRWRLLRDGKDLLPNTFKNVWNFDQKDDRMRVYGSKFRTLKREMHNL